MRLLDSISIGNDYKEMRNWLLPKLFRPQPKIEWSEEDKHNLNSVINLVHATTDGAWGSCIGDGIENWLKSLPERFNLQPKQEWSKEETKDLVHILKVLDDCYAYGKHDLSKTDHDNLTSTIKSLRPSWKPSEEQMEALKYFIKLWGNSDDQLEYTKIFNTVKSLRDALEKLM